MDYSKGGHCPFPECLVDEKDAEIAQLKARNEKLEVALNILLKPIDKCMEANKPSHKGQSPDGQPFRQLSVALTFSYNQIRQVKDLIDMETQWRYANELRK